MRWTAFYLCVLLLASALPPSAPAASLIHYTSKFESDPKQDVTLSTDTGYTFQIQPGFDNGIQFFGAKAHGYDNVSVLFSAAGDLPLAVGTYTDTTEFGDDMTSGLTFGGTENSPVASAQGPGEFRVLEITSDASGHVLTFAADFVQRSSTVKAVSRGQVRYNSDVPLSTPGGTAEFKNATEKILETAGGLTVRVSRNGGSAGALAINYATADGTDLAGRDYTAAAGTLSWADGDAADKTITIPILDSGNPLQGDGTFSVHLSGASVGLQAQDVVTVVNENSSVTFVHVLYPPNTINGKATERTFSLDTGFILSAQQRNGLNGPDSYQAAVEFSFNNQAAAGDDNSEFWDLDFSAPRSDGSLLAGDYKNAQQYPVEGNDPGLDFSGDGLGSDSLTGNFEVLEAQYDAAGNVLKFAANFEDYPDGSTQPVRGEVRFNSNAGLPVFTSQVSAIAEDSFLADYGSDPALFTIVRAGTTTAPLTVNYTLSGQVTGGANFLTVSGTKTIKAGKSSVRVRVSFADLPATDDKIVFQLNVLPAADGSYTVASPGGNAKVKLFR